MKTLWWLLLLLPPVRKIHRAIIQLAKAANIPHPMRLTQTAMLAVIAAAIVVIEKAKAAVAAAQEALKPLQDENEDLKGKLATVDAADAELDAELTKLREALPAEDQPPVEEETPPPPGPGPDETGPQGEAGTPGPQG